MMGFHELTRKELQALCKQNGLPANKTNVVMATSLTSFFSDQQTITQAYGELLTPSTAGKSVRNRGLPKPERLETSLASLILGTPQPPVKGALLKKCKEPVAESTLLVNTTPLRRRGRKKSDAIPNPSTCVEDATSRDSTENLRVLPEEISVCTSQAATEKISSPEPQHVNGDGLVTDSNQNPPRTRRELECQEAATSGACFEMVVKTEAQLSSTSGSEPVASSSALHQDCQNVLNPGCSQPVLIVSPLRRITANVDTLIRRTTGMLEKFEQWKIDNPNDLDTVVHGSGQMLLSFDKENLHQQSPWKNSKLRSLQGCMGAQLNRKEATLKDVALNGQT